MEIGDRILDIGGWRVGRGEKHGVRCGKRTEEEDWEMGGFRRENISHSLSLPVSLSLSLPFSLFYLSMAEGDGREQSSNNPSRIHFRKCSRRLSLLRPNTTVGEVSKGEDEEKWV